MTEFALVLPILALLLFGVIQFGLIWPIQQAQPGPPPGTQLPISRQAIST